MKWLKSLDKILRGEATRPDAIQGGRIEIPIVGVGVLLLVLSMIYGACMGSFSLFKEGAIEDGNGRYLQVLASTLKVPSLYLLTLIVTFPSLYVFNALVGSRLHLGTLLRLLVASLAVNLAVLASMGPITAFFSVSTTSYPFMKLFNVAVFGIAGLLGLAFLIQTLNRLTARDGDGHDVSAVDAKKATSESESKPSRVPSMADGYEASGDESLEASDENLPAPISDVDLPIGALDLPVGHALSQHVKSVFRIWIVVFGLVGAQMGWVLRPFIGDPSQPFTWFRQRESNIFLAILEAIVQLLGGA